MARKLVVSSLAMAVAAGWSLPTAAQTSDHAEIQSELEEMRAQMEAMAQRINTLEGQLQVAQAAAQTANSAAQAAQQAASSAQETAEEASEAAEGGSSVEWKGAPKISGEGGWTFKPRGRLNIDAGFINAPESTGRTDGFGSEMRRARLGVEGDIPGGFGYKFEVDFGGGSAEVTDAILTYKDGDLKLSFGQHNTFQSLEELSSSRHTSFIERAAFTDAFGFERRLGVSAQYGSGDFLVQAGLFSDAIGDIPNQNWSADGRVVYFPKTGNTQLHFGGSVHLTDLEAGSTVRYRQRPYVHFTGERFINTNRIAASKELGLGLEAAAISGPFHIAAEGFWQKVDRMAPLADPTFFGGYVEAGVFLTSGDKRGYKKGTFDRVKPANPVDKGGMGAWQVNLRYDYLDLNDAGIVGGQQNAYQLSLNWKPVDYVLFGLNYAHIVYDDAAVAAGTATKRHLPDAQSPGRQEAAGALRLDAGVVDYCSGYQTYEPSGPR